MVVGLVFAAWGLAVVGSQDAFQETLSQFAATLPQWVVALLRFTYTLGLLYAVAVIIMFARFRRWAALRDVGLAAIGSTAVTLVLVSIFDKLWPSFFNEFLTEPLEPQFPVVRVAVVTAVLVAATPYLARPIRRLGWVIVVLISAAAIALALSVPSGVWSAVGVGLVSGAGVLVVFGSPRGYPDVESVRLALGRLSIDVPDLALDPDQSWGARRLVGTTTNGGPITVKAYGRDATDSQAAAKLWHALMYRGGSRQIMASRLQSVEHEALLTMLADRADVSVPKVVAAAAATDDVAVLATTRRGLPLSQLDAAVELDPAALVQLWRQVAAMHTAGIVHSNLNSETVRLVGSNYEITDFNQASIDYQSSDEALDIAQLLFTTATRVGVAQAVTAAAAGLDHARLESALPYLQPPAIGRRERRDADDAKSVLEELRQAVADECAVEIPEPVKLRRVGIRQILTVVLVLFFLSAMIPLLTSVDYAELWSSISNATWWLVALAVFMGQLAFLPQGTAMMSAVARPIPLRPMTILQPAIAFISFAVPGVAGRVAMEGSFLYKYGVAPAVAVTKGAVDAFSGFLVQAVLLITAFLTGALTITQTTSTTGSHTGTSWVVIAVIVGVAVAVVVAVWQVPKLHDRVVPQIRKAWEALTEVLRSPKLALGLLGSQLAVQLCWGMALWLALRSLGTELDLIACIAVVVATSLLQGIIPVPGGIGVSEAVMSAFLIPLGVSPEVAMGGAVIWRVSTFYLPATEGFFASKYLSNHGYL